MAGLDCDWRLRALALCLPICQDMRFEIAAKCMLRFS